MPPTQTMTLLLVSLSGASALVLHHRCHHYHAPGLDERAGRTAMQHSKGWDDFGKPPFNFYKVSPDSTHSNSNIIA